MPIARPSSDAVQAALDEHGYVVVPELIEPVAVDRALRTLNLGIVRHGLSPDEIEQCATTTFFPHLRWDDSILALREPLDRLLPESPGDEWADPQLLLRFPDEAPEWPLVPHVDGVPPWAGDRQYRFIAGVALTRSMRRDGCLAVWPRSHMTDPIERASDVQPVELDAGDVILMHPNLQHSSTLNRGGAVRYAVYFRRLAAVAPLVRCGRAHPL